MHGAYFLVFSTPVYIALAYAATQRAIANPTHHDLFYLYNEYAVYAIPTLLIISMLVSALSKPNYDLLFKRIALMGILKSISQLESSYKIRFLNILIYSLSNDNASL